jgi:hypothetical protein
MPSVVLLDDREAVLGTSNSNFVISMLKWGATATGRYTAPLPHGRVHEFLLFCPKALAGTAPLPRAIQERCIPMLLKRIKNDQSLKTFDPRFIRERVQSLRDWLQLWAQENLEFLGLLPFDTPSHLPRGLTKEQIEYTAPLMRICDALGEPWHTDGRIAIGDVYCKNWRGNVACDAGSDPRQLLQDISDAFTAAGKPAHVFSRSLAGHLQKLDDRPWYHWGKSPTYALARMLRPLGVYSRDIASALPPSSRFITMKILWISGSATNERFRPVAHPLRTCCGLCFAFSPRLTREVAQLRTSAAYCQTQKTSGPAGRMKRAPIRFS